MEMESTNQLRAGGQDDSKRSHTNADHVEYIGVRVNGTALVLNLTEHERLSPERSLELVRHSPAGFEWGYAGSGPAQLACALLLDYYDNEHIAQEYYIRFRNEVVSQLNCDGPADCWHLTGVDIDAALTEVHTQQSRTPDGGKPSPSLPSNWDTVNRSNRMVFQRRDVDHYIVLSEGTEEWTVLLCAQGDRAYPAPLGVRRLPIEDNPGRAIQELVAESNDLVEPSEGGS